MALTTMLCSCGHDPPAVCQRTRPQKTIPSAPLDRELIHPRSDALPGLKHPSVHNDRHVNPTSSMKCNCGHSAVLRRQPRKLHTDGHANCLVQAGHHTSTMGLSLIDGSTARIASSAKPAGTCADVDDERGRLLACNRQDTRNMGLPLIEESTIASSPAKPAMNTQLSTSTTSMASAGTPADKH